MNRSINEVEAMAKRAARGAGMSWGLAEEAAQSIASLEEMGLPGAELLSVLLEMNDGVAAVNLSPQSLTGAWSASAGRLCPVIVGACLSDFSNVLQTGERITMQEVSCPLLVLPFVNTVARSLNVNITLEWDDVLLCTDGYFVAIQGDRQQLFLQECKHMSCGINEQRFTLRTKRHRAGLNEHCWQKLADYAHRTYAPATEESRRLGAGAGQTDND